MSVDSDIAQAAAASAAASATTASAAAEVAVDAANEPTVLPNTTVTAVGTAVEDDGLVPKLMFSAPSKWVWGPMTAADVDAIPAGDITVIDVITQAAYDALPTKVATTLYVIVG